MIDKIIADLYKTTLTPQQKSSDYTSTALPDSIAAVLSSGDRGMTFKDFSDQDVVNFVHFVLRLVDSTPGLRGILRAENCIRHLVSVCLKEVLVDQNTIRLQFLAVLDQWFKALQVSVLSDRVILFKKPFIKDSALLHFHIYAHNRSLLPGNVFPFYAAYGHKFHRAIREFKRKNPSQTQFQSAVRAARYFFQYISAHILTMPNHPDNMPVHARSL